MSCDTRIARKVQTEVEFLHPFLDCGLAPLHKDASHNNIEPLLYRFKTRLLKFDKVLVRDGICVDPPLCRGTSQGFQGSRVLGLVCKSETVGKVREVDEMGERELVLVVSVRCGKERDMTRG